MKNSYRRAIASIIDFIIAIILFFGSTLLFNVCFVNNNQTYQNNIKILTTTLEETELFIYKDGNLVSREDKLDYYITEFYKDHDYYDFVDKYTSYVEAKAKSDLFEEIDNQTYEKEGKEKELSIFYARELEKVQASIYNSDKAYREALDYNHTVISIGGFVTVIVSSLIVYLVVPLILKNGQTVGLKIVKLKMVSLDNKKASFWQLCIHAWATTFIILLAWKFYFLSILINIIVFLVNKEHRSISDFAAVTLCLQEGEIYEEKRR